MLSSNPPPKKKGRSWIYGVALLLLLVACGAGAALLVRRETADRRELRHEREGLARVVEWLRSGKPADLVRARSTLETEKRPLLDAYAQQLALRERVISTVVTGERQPDIGDVLRRARAAGVSNKGLAAGKVAEALGRGDLAAALAAVKEGATAGRQDPYFHTVAGFTYEQLGESEALGEYSIAHELDPGLAIASVLYARLLVLKKGARAARSAVQRIADGLDDKLQAKALRGLVDVLDDTAAPDAQAPYIEPAEVSRLPAPLRAVAGLQASRKALAAGQTEAARAPTRDAAEHTASPFLLARIASFAFAARDIEVPGSIATRLEQLDSDDPMARLIRARIALLKGDLAGASRLVDRVEKANAARLDHSAVAIVRAIIAYEREDLTGLRSILDESVKTDRDKERFSALSVGVQLMQGHAPSIEKIDALFRSTAPWADLIAVDAAFQLGRTEHASHLMEGWVDVLDRPLHLLRTARAARYAGHNSDAASSCRQALDAGVNTFDALAELVYALLANGDAHQAEQMVVKHKDFEGPQAELWFRVLVRGVMGRPLLRRAKLPNADSPLRLRVLAAYALARARDPRLRGLLADLRSVAPAEPDVVALSRGAR